LISSISPIPRGPPPACMTAHARTTGTAADTGSDAGGVSRAPAHAAPADCRAGKRDRDRGSTWSRCRKACPGDAAQRSAQRAHSDERCTCALPTHSSFPLSSSCSAAARTALTPVATPHATGTARTQSKHTQRHARTHAHTHTDTPHASTHACTHAHTPDGPRGWRGCAHPPPDCR